MDRRALQGQLSNHYFAGTDRRDGDDRREVIERHGVGERVAQIYGFADRRNG
ncbi:MAG: hypothetical protein O6766_12455 [Gammaproteobacteria bacterium]|nr:hypothetical protein [Gammaproteobacteria bacterium]